jgi:hypothetical protein
MPSLDEILLREVRDILSSSSVGLYEFIWILRTIAPDLRDEERIRMAERVLNRLVGDSSYHLVLLRWPSEQTIEVCGMSDVSSESWGDPTLDSPYIALVQSED